MALFRPKCARCGKARTSREYEGVPTCESCEETIRAKLQAAAENRHRCPLDEAEMEKEIVLNIVIDRCPTCHGVWLDGGELDQMKRMIQADLTTELVRGMTYPF